jgi:hypothetical protein
MDRGKRIVLGPFKELFNYLVTLDYATEVERDRTDVSGAKELMVLVKAMGACKKIEFCGELAWVYATRDFYGDLPLPVDAFALQPTTS